MSRHYSYAEVQALLLQRMGRMSQSVAASHIGCSQATVSGFLSGKIPPPPLVLHWLGIPTQYWGPPRPDNRSAPATGKDDEK